MKKTRFLYFLFVVLFLNACSTNEKAALNDSASQAAWPDSIPWWKSNNLRLIQTNLPAYEAGLNPDSLVTDLVYFSANTLIINAGGIMAFYPTKLEFQYINPYMKENMLRDVIEKCHQHRIKVIVRFDFSRAHKSIFEKHPEWFYVSSSGERIINDDMYVVSINAPYEQEWLFKIIEEVIDNYAIDGIFMNMPGYQTRNSYIGKYYGIDQNAYDKKRFAEFSGEKKFPVAENEDDPLFQKYQAFKKFTTDDLLQRIHKLVKSKSKQIAICTYLDKHVDIIRHESQTNGLPYWPYSASDNVNNIENSFPDKIVSNASIQQVSFQSRYNAIEPEETTIRLYENVANGSGLDISLMGDFQDYEDERNFPVFKRLYDHHKKYESYFGKYYSPAKVAVIAPGYWPGGDAAQEYRGIQLMLKESHIQFDIIEDSQIAAREDAIKKYRLIILPEITHIDTTTVKILTEASSQGVNLIATNHSFYDTPEALLKLFGAKVVNKDHDGSGYYLSPDNKDLFKSFRGQKLLLWKFNLGFYDFAAADTSFLPVYTPGRPGPPEIIGGHEPSGYNALGIKKHGKSQAILLPANLGKLYYLLGYKEHKNILLDVMDYIFPEVREQLQTSAHERVEVVLQKYIRNIPENIGKTSEDGMILHLVNITGFSGNTYFKPLTQYGIDFRIKSDFKPTRIFSMVGEKSMNFTWDDGHIKFTVDKLEAFDGIVIEK